MSKQKIFFVFIIIIILFNFISCNSKYNATTTSNKNKLVGMWKINGSYGSHIGQGDPLSYLGGCNLKFTDYGKIIEAIELSSTTVYDTLSYEIIGDTLKLEDIKDHTGFRNYKLKYSNDTLYATFMYKVGDIIYTNILAHDESSSSAPIGSQNYFTEATKEWVDSVNNNHIPFAVKLVKLNSKYEKEFSAVTPTNSTTNEPEVEICGTFFGEDNVGMQSSIEILSNGTTISHPSVGDGKPAYGTWEGRSQSGNVVYISLYQKDEMGRSQFINRIGITKDGVEMNGKIWHRR